MFHDGHWKDYHDGTIMAMFWFNDIHRVELGGVVVTMVVSVCRSSNTAKPRHGIR